MAFRRVSLGLIDETRVTLNPIREEGGRLLGRVQTLALNEQGEVELMDISDLSINDAIMLASQIAGFKEQDVDVLDPDGLWTCDLGKLE